MQVRCLGRDDSPGRGHGNPLQYSCLENPTGRGTWQAVIHRSQRVRDSWARTQSIAKKAGDPEWCLNYFWERACSVMFVSVTCQECGEGAPCLGLAWGRKISETGHLRDAASDLIVCYRKCWGQCCFWLVSVWADKLLWWAWVCVWIRFMVGLVCVCVCVDMPFWWAWCVCVYTDTVLWWAWCVCVDMLLWWVWGVCVCVDMLLWWAWCVCVLIGFCDGLGVCVSVCICVCVCV